MQLGMSLSGLRSALRKAAQVAVALTGASGTEQQQWQSSWTGAAFCQCSPEDCRGYNLGMHCAQLLLRCLVRIDCYPQQTLTCIEVSSQDPPAPTLLVNLSRASTYELPANPAYGVHSLIHPISFLVPQLFQQQQPCRPSPPTT